MTTPVVERVPTPAEVAYHRLTGRLAQLADDGIDWPCRGDGALWFADDGDDRALAAALCHGCPALDACRHYADTAAERWGVWGGRDRTPRPRRKEPDR